MSAIHAILLVPAEGDPLGLLADGPCGARPPTAFWREPFQRWQAGVVLAEGAHPGPRRALALAWGGKAVAEGCDRADWCREWVPHWVPERAVVYLVMAVLGLSKRKRDHVATLATHLADIGTLIFLDADGREVTL